ncbi:hypothetical protein A8C32_03420 [Flavivirga aquatica]|uniref:Secretion system C-terminal sorting domain-containing protein n=1 Tax=Flavivirga aquatica TaxID=1849968 RepID=A0A1E5TAV8_9FLAO|nr:T9SS type A sorting domain-containing protein [Flavivirga aquatica]OEK08515.1 hypothetical protein A8C32_03420 [Flavivirga aquatica]
MKLIKIKIMMKKLLKSSLLILTVFIAGTIQMNAQADIEFTFDGTTFEDWNGQGGDGAFVSVFANSNPGGALNISWPTVGASTRNVILYGAPSVQTMNADDRKFMRVRLSNTDPQIDVLRIRGRVSGGSFLNFIDVPIGLDTVGNFSTYSFEITDSAFAGALDRFQIIFKNSSNNVLTANANANAILVDNILVSANTTLSTNSFNKNELSVRVFDGKLNAPEASDYKIYNITGAIAKEGEGAKTIDISNLASGLYIYKTSKGFAKFIK